MAKTILFLLFLIPAMLGLAEFLHLFKLYILYPKHNSSAYVLIFLENENPVEQLNFTLEQSNWFGKKYAKNIIAVNSSLEGEKYELCRNIALRHNAIFCTEKELETVLKNINN